MGQRKTTVVIVLGMHRSGTSCLTGCLQEAGLSLGQVNERAPHNARGNREDPRIMSLHDDVLAASGGSWDAPPAVVAWTKPHLEKRDAILRDCEALSPWGFKDPRTLLTLEGWRDPLPDLRAVGTYRHPLAVARSLRTRNGFPFEKSMALWAHYNDLLLRYVDELELELVSFDLPRADYVSRVEQMALHLGLTPPSAGFDFFSEPLRTATPADDRALPPSVAEILRRLEAAST